MQKGKELHQNVKGREWENERNCTKILKGESAKIEELHQNIKGRECENERNCTKILKGESAKIEGIAPKF